MNSAPAPTPSAIRHGRQRAARSLAWQLLAAALAVLLLLALGMGTGLLPWTPTPWPWPDLPMSFTLLAAIAAGMAVVWLGLAWAGIPRWAAGMGVYLLCSGVLWGACVWAGAVPIGPAEAASALAASGPVAAALGAVLLLLSRPAAYSALPTPPLPPAVRWGFVALAFALLGSGVALLMQLPTVLPWRVHAAHASLVGCLFIGAAAYYAFEACINRWASGALALAGFLAYDAVLWPPYVRMLFAPGTAPLDEYGGAAAAEINIVSLGVYLSIIGASTVLGLWAFLVCRSTRLLGRGR